jgi:uncharacterized protein YjbI with pentapeptide repeats
MGVIWLKLLILVILANLLSAVAIPVRAQEADGKQTETCSLPIGWDPAEDFPRILAEHREWAAKWADNDYFSQWAVDHPEGRANLCNANLRGVQLNEADLVGAELNKANLSYAQLNKADLVGAELNKANLSYAQLNKADLVGAELNKADLGGVQLNEANLFGAQLNKANLPGVQLNKANLFGAGLNKANLFGAQLNKANLRGVHLNEADLVGAELNKADLVGAELNKANLSYAQLNKADLRRVQLSEANLFGAQLNKAVLIQSGLKDTHLAAVNLTDAIYAPASPPPDAYVADIEGLRTIVFPKGNEAGLVQLRELLQKAGLRDLEREATYAIEHGRTWHAICLQPVEFTPDDLHMLLMHIAPAAQDMR